MVRQLAEEAVTDLAAVVHIKTGGDEAVQDDELGRQKT
jgi:hypothetical protein